MTCVQSRTVDARSADPGQRRGGVTVIRLAREPVNAVDLELVRELEHHVDMAAGDSNLGLVITGIPQYFCSGIDTRLVPAYGEDARREMLNTINRVIGKLYAFRRPVVAAVCGHAIGAGAVLPLTADERIGADGPYRIGLTEAAAGIPFPAGPLVVVRSELTAAQTRGLALTSRTVDPVTAVSWGLLDRVIAADELLTEAVERVVELAAQPGFAAVKAQLRGAVNDQLSAIVEAEDDPLLKRWVIRE